MPAEHGTHALLIPLGTERALGVKAFRDLVDSLDPKLSQLFDAIAELQDTPSAVTEILAGTLANRPAPGSGTTPRLYVVTGDTPARNGVIYLDDATAWTQVGGTGTGGSSSLLPPIQPSVAVAYDGAGNLFTVTVTAADGTTQLSKATYTYDAAGNMTKVVTVARVTNGSTVTTVTRTRTNSYNGAGVLTGFTETEASS
jgi:YD repeat-containing protein